LFIYAWEHVTTESRQPPHFTTRFAVDHLPLVALSLIAASIGLALFDRRTVWPLSAATSLSALLLSALHLGRRRYSILVLRASADLALLTPILLIPFL
jgi:hypothetical protein